jgi:hypothetical protein
MAGCEGVAMVFANYMVAAHTPYCAAPGSALGNGAFAASSSWARIGGTLGVNLLRLPLIHIAVVDPVLASLSLLLLTPFLKLFAFLAAVAHNSTPFSV